MKCVVCKRKVLWLKQESGRSILVDYKDQEGREVNRNEIFDPSIHYEHSKGCYELDTKKKKFVDQLK